MSKPVLTVRNLRVSIRSQDKGAMAVDGVSFALRQGEVLAVVGESGCGKTKTAESILGLLPTDTWDVQAEAIELDGVSLPMQSERKMRKIRGREISMIFQEPQTALDPVFTIGNQLCSIYRRHRNKNRKEATLAALDKLQQVGFADPRRILHSYAHQLSGGMRQRVMITMAMACRPRVLIADEPTTALDVTTQAQVLSRMTLLGREFGTSILLITHDLGIVAQYCDRVLVMHDGRIVEKATVHELFTDPQQPYTRRLLAAVPKVRTA